MREAYRRQESSLAKGIDIVITLRSSDEVPPYDCIKGEMERLFGKLKIYG